MSEAEKKDARQLRKLDFDLANYFSNTLIPQLFIDADLILRIFTPPAMKQFDLSIDDVGRSIHDVKDNIRYPTIVQNIEEVITKNINLEKEIQTTDGNWFEMNIVPYIEHEENRINGVIITFVNITKRLATQKELEKLNSDHETLMFALSHDVKQPITALALLADGLSQAFIANDSEKFGKLIKTFKKTSIGMAALVDDFTANNRKLKKEEPQELRLNIEEIIVDVLTALKYEIKINKIEVDTEFNTSEIIFPRNNLRSIVYNLVHNAIKYRDPKKVSKIEIATEKVRDFVILCVKDNGPGIPREHQRKIFNKSWRIRQDVKGTGMGLYIVKKMVEANDGRIKLESQPGEGATFKVFFRSEFSSRKTKNK